MVKMYSYADRVWILAETKRAGIVSHYQVMHLGSVLSVIRHDEFDGRIVLGLDYLQDVRQVFQSLPHRKRDTDQWGSVHCFKSRYL